MTKFSWNEKLEKRVIIERLNGIREQDDEGVKYKGFSFERLSAILTSCIKTSQHVRQSDLQDCIRHSLFRMQEGGFITPQQFLDDCELRLKQIQKVAQKKFVLVTRMTYHGKMPTRVFSLSGSTLDLSPRRLAKFFRNEESGRSWAIEKLGRLRHYEIDSQLPFCTVTTMGRSIEDAFQNSMAALDTFRGLVNLFFNRRRGQRISSGIPPQPVNDLRLGLLQTLHRRDGLIHTDKIWYQLDYIARNS